MFQCGASERSLLAPGRISSPNGTLLESGREWSPIVRTVPVCVRTPAATTEHTRLVKLFYANLEVVQNDDRGLVLQSTVAGHIITVDPQVISHIIRVPVLEISASPYNEVVLPPSLDDLREFFHAIPQGEERSTSIRIGALSPSHRMLAKIIQQNIWHVARRSDLILKRA
jgi:hypothetical protein